MSTSIQVQRELAGPLTKIHSTVVPVRVLADAPFDGVLVSAEPHVVEQIETLLEGDVLWIRPHSGSSFSTSVPIEVLVSTTTLEQVSASAGSRVKLLNLQQERLEVSAVSGGQIEVHGRVQTLVALAESGGSVDLSRAQTRNVSTSAVSGGRIH